MTGPMTTHGQRLSGEALLAAARPASLPAFAALVTARVAWRAVARLDGDAAALDLLAEAVWQIEIELEAMRSAAKPSRPAIEYRSGSVPTFGVGARYRVGAQARLSVDDHVALGNTMKAFRAELLAKRAGLPKSHPVSKAWTKAYDALSTFQAQYDALLHGTIASERDPRELRQRVYYGKPLQPRECQPCDFQADAFAGWSIAEREA